jgi:hypothetical protein
MTQADAAREFLFHHQRFLSLCAATSLSLLCGVYFHVLFYSTFFRISPKSLLSEDNKNAAAVAHQQKEETRTSEI